MLERLNVWLAARASRPGRFGIRGRLFVGFGLVLACLGGITALAYITLGHTVGTMQRSAESQAALASTTAEMARRVSAANIALLGASIATDAQDGTDLREDGLQALKDYNTAQAKLDALMARTPEFAPLKEQVEILRDEAHGTRMMLDAMVDRVGDPTQRDTIGPWMSGSAQSGFRMWTKRLTDLEALRTKTSIAQTGLVQASAHTAAIVLLAVAGLAIVIGLGAAWQISRGVVGPVQRAVVMSQRVAQGDLSHAIEGNEGGEVGALLGSLSQMQDGLRTLVRDVQRSTDGMAVASGEVAMGNQDLSVRTEQTAAELQRTAQSIQQLSQTVSRTADAAQTANNLAGSTSQAAQRGSDAISQVVVSMTTISAASSKIAEITSVIDGIAFQTNILALNAAVEAARAGEQGRGFAVVATEVRALAQRSAKAAKEIKTLIDANVATVGTGEQQVSGAVDEMQQIFDGVRKVSEVIADISRQTNNQAGELAQVTGAVGRVDAMTQQNAALVEQGAAAAESLREEAVRLKQAVGNFHLEEGEGGSPLLLAAE